jgi:hypothetical protein
MEYFNLKPRKNRSLNGANLLARQPGHAMSDIKRELDFPVHRYFDVFFVQQPTQVAPSHKF